MFVWARAYLQVRNFEAAAECSGWLDGLLAEGADLLQRAVGAHDLARNLVGNAPQHP